MENSRWKEVNLVEMVVAASHQMMHARENTTDLDWATETIIGSSGHLSRKDVLYYLRAYKAEMSMRAILEARKQTKVLQE